MAHFLIESLKSSRSNNNQDCENAASLYPVTMLTTGGLCQCEQISATKFWQERKLSLTIILLPTPHSRRVRIPFLGGSITCNTTIFELNNCNYCWRLDLSLPAVTQLWMNYRTVDMIQAQDKKSGISYTGHIKYHRRYQIYPVNQGLTINNRWKIRSDFDW